MARSTTPASTTGPCLQPRFSPSSRWKTRHPPTTTRPTRPPKAIPPFPQRIKNGSYHFVDNNQTETDQNATGPAPGDPVVTLFRPLPKTLAREELENGKIRLWGMILANGGSPITKAAFELADNMLFRNSIFIPHPFSQAVRTSTSNSNSNPASATTTERWSPTRWARRPDQPRSSPPRATESIGGPTPS